MWIEQLRLQGVGPFHDEATFSFGCECTVVAGENASGKTSLTSAIFGALYGLPPDSPLVATDGRAWAELSFRKDDQLYEVRQDFRSQHATLIHKSEGRQLFDGSLETPGGRQDYLGCLASIIGSESEEWCEAASKLRGVRGDLEEKEAALKASRQTTDEQDEILQNFARFDELSQERSRLEAVLVQLRDERDRTRDHVETQERAKARLQHEYAGFLEAPANLGDLIQNWIDASHAFKSLERDLDREEAALFALAPTKTLRNGVITAGVLALLTWLVCQGSGEGDLGLLLAPFFAALGFGVVWYVNRSSERVRAAYAWEHAQRIDERNAADAVYQDARRKLGKLAKYKTPDALRQAFREYMKIQEDLERVRSASESFRPLSEVQDSYEQVFAELQVLDTQTRDLVAQARYLSGMDAQPHVMAKKIEEARETRAEAKKSAEELAPVVEELRATLESTEAEFLRLSVGLPLVLDEPFADWDDGRLAEARETVSALVQSGRQAIVLSADPRLRSWVDEVIELHREDNGHGSSQLGAA